MDDLPELLRPSEVAALFRVDPKTVARWAREGRLSHIRTPSGHRRFHAEPVRALLAGEAPPPAPPPARAVHRRWSRFDSEPPDLEEAL